MFIIHEDDQPKRAAQWRTAGRSLFCLPCNLVAYLLGYLQPSPDSPTQKQVAIEPPYIPLSLRSDAANAQSQSTLLALPTELRCMIWKCLLSEKQIAL
jgi:hypothetical protein